MKVIILMLQVFSETPLHVATTLGFTEIIKLLIGFGAAINVQCGAEKMTPLHFAAEDGDVRITKILIDAGALVSSRNRKSKPHYIWLHCHKALKQWNYF